MYIAQDHHSTTFKIIIANDVRFRDINVRRENSYFPGLECWRRRIRIHRQNSKSNRCGGEPHWPRVRSIPGFPWRKCDLWSLLVRTYTASHYLLRPHEWIVSQRSTRWNLNSKNRRTPTNRTRKLAHVPVKSGEWKWPRATDVLSGRVSASPPWAWHMHGKRAEFVQVGWWSRMDKHVGEGVCE